MHDLTTTRFRNPIKNQLVYAIKQQIYKQVTVRAARKSAAIFTPSEFVKKDVAEFTDVSPSKISVTYEAADIFDDQAISIPALEQKQFIMFNGRPLPHKNLHRLIEAFAQLHGRHPELYLMIGGKKDASQASYVALANRLGISNRVVITDWISDGQLKWAMKHTKAYVWPSLSEGFGLPPLEAMLYGAPVASSNATCMPEILGDAAHYFDPYDITAIADAIDELLTNKDLRQQLIVAGKAHAATYSWERMARQTLEVYKKVLGE
jgi:glycosyltransferase involved in cell wall biosynthesis